MASNIRKVENIRTSYLRLDLGNMEELLRFIKGKPDSRELKRALAVKLVIEKYPYHQISAILNVSIGFISKWKTAFEEKGISGLKLAHKGAKGYLNLEQKSEVIRWLKEKDYWNLPELQSRLYEKYGVSFKSKQSYYDLFAEAGISWKKSRRRNSKRSHNVVTLKSVNSSSMNRQSNQKMVGRCN
ncbi:winged helix-turn-helix domain-containing protein [Lyngbya aestuarii]|uniref:winged helix-turn-helix domain-containing protein n=1 Tax=Lyngbya aestuarii TaxID=118322 RepID=UPI00403E1679